MGVEFYITRAEFWAENEEVQITPEEWLSLIDSDNELTRDLKNGDYHALWSGASSYDEAWLEWSDGNLYTKWPDTQLYRKMLEIAGCLNAKVMDEDGNIYSNPSEGSMILPLLIKRQAALSLMVREGAVRHCIGNEREYQPHYLLPPAPAMLVV